MGKEIQKIRKTRIWRHVGVNNTTVMCLEKMFGKPCPICDHARKLKNSAKKEINEENK